MMIVCPTCSTSYQVQVASLGDTGRSVRCVRCRTVWFASPPNRAGAEPGAPIETEAAAVAADVALEGFEPGSPDRPDAVETAASGEEAIVAPADEADHGTTDWGLPEDQPDKEAQASPAREPDELDRIAPDEAPPLSPAASDPAEGPANAAPVHLDGEIKTAAPRRSWQAVPRLRVRRPRSGAVRASVARFALPERSLPGLVVVFLMISAALVIGRTQIVRAMPQMASFYSLLGLTVNLRGLAFEGVAVTRELKDKMPVLVVRGTIVNTTQTVLEVPRLRFDLRDSKGGEVYTWTALAERAVLGPGQKDPFNTRLASPPIHGREVVIRFAGGGSAAAKRSE